ncbi:hypothetical protein L1987_05236 [Smallanthus sonchifolius]|uniref:Uncharacterized protein n=1 Tax=Smallanthus sonchifolius TaxID=185202 RepID=A0ACB9JUT1_9ASTR|nr:hypothetical protein L1987_05236 [Smallanthus sonchifolius]
MVVLLARLKESWINRCRRVIELDGCFLKTLCKGVKRNHQRAYNTMVATCADPSTNQGGPMPTFKQKRGNGGGAVAGDGGGLITAVAETYEQQGSELGRNLPTLYCREPSAITPISSKVQ